MLVKVALGVQGYLCSLYDKNQMNCLPFAHFVIKQLLLIFSKY